jgi:hypothetical protein
MAEPNHDPILDKIRKLLAQAEDDACTPAEAEAFTAKAAQLIAKYGIDRAMLADAQPDTDRIGDRTIVMDAPYARDKAGLLHAIAVPLRCKTVLHRRYVAGRKQLSIHLFGYAADLDRVELLYTSLLVQAAHALAVEPVPYWESRRRTGGPGTPATPPRSAAGCARPRPAPRPPSSRPSTASPTRRAPADRWRWCSPTAPSPCSTRWTPPTRTCAPAAPASCPAAAPATATPPDNAPTSAAPA